MLKEESRIKLLFASDSFKGSLTSRKTAALLKQAANKVFEHAECESILVADGGEGTVDAVIEAVKGEKIYAEVKGPLFEKVRAYYGKVSEKTAVIEMAAASGLTLIDPHKRNPLLTTTYGTGELLKDALDRGFSEIVIAIGGSATNDGGMGCLEALGAKFLDSSGNELSGIGSNLSKIADINLSDLDKRLNSVKLNIMCDVTNPLCGPDGATYTFGRQKGGTPEILDELEKGMVQYRDMITEKFGINPDEIPGSGAAGGLGTALTVFLNGQLSSGIETVLNLIDFNGYLEDVDLVVTGEGRTDWQSCFGKVLQGIGERCRKHNVPVVALSGSLGEGGNNVLAQGISSVMTTVDRPMTITEAMSDAENLYLSGAERMFRMIKTGMLIHKRRNI